MADQQEHPNTIGLIGDALVEAQRLFSSIAELAKAEMRQNFSSITRAAGIGAVALSGLWMATLFLLLSIAALLISFGLSAAAALFIIAIVLAGGSALLAMKARSDLAGSAIVPVRTIEEVRNLARPATGVVGNGR